jgi:hypothetical protein
VLQELSVPGCRDARSVVHVLLEKVHHSGLFADARNPRSHAWERGADREQGSEKFRRTPDSARRSGRGVALYRRQTKRYRDGTRALNPLDESPWKIAIDHESSDDELRDHPTTRVDSPPERPSVKVDTVIEDQRYGPYEVRAPVRTIKQSVYELKGPIASERLLNSVNDDLRGAVLETEKFKVARHAKPVTGECLCKRSELLERHAVCPANDLPFSGGDAELIAVKLTVTVAAAPSAATAC